MVAIVALFIFFGFSMEKYSEFGKVKQKPVWKVNPKQFIALAGSKPASMAPIRHNPIKRFSKIQSSLK